MEKRLAFWVALIMLSGCLGQAPTPQETTVPTVAPTVTPGTPVPSLTATPVPVNPVFEYAKEKGLSVNAAQTLSPLGSDGLQDSDKLTVDLIASLPSAVRDYAAAKIMADSKIGTVELDILRASAINANTSPYIWNMSFMNSFDENTLKYIQFLNSVWSNNSGLAEKIMSDKRLSGYETTLLEIYEKDPAYAKKVAQTELLIRDGKLTPAEEAYLLNPSDDNETKVREELLKPYKNPVINQIEGMNLETLDDVTYAFPQDRLDYEMTQGHMGPEDFTGLSNLLTIFEPDGYAAYALFALSGAPEMQDDISLAEKTTIENEIIPGSMKLDGSLPEILNPLGGPILWNIAKSSVDVSSYPKIVYGLTVSHQPLMEIADQRISDFVLDQTLQKAMFGIENEKDSRISWNLEDMPFEAVNSWAFIPMMEYGKYFEPGEETINVVKIDYDYLMHIYPKNEMTKKYKFIIPDLTKDTMDNARSRLVRVFYGEEDTSKFHYVSYTGFKTAEDMYSEIKENGFVQGDCTNRSFLMSLSSNSVNIPSKENIRIFKKEKGTHMDLNTGIFTGEKYLFVGSQDIALETFYFSPVLIEFDSEGNIITEPTLNMEYQTQIPSSWFEDQIYKAWLKRWKK